MILFRRLSWRARIRLLLASVLLVLATQAFWVEPSSLERNTYPVKASLLTPACEGLRLVVLADLHVGSPHNGLDKLRLIVASANAARPDLVLLAGDYVIQGVIGGEFTEPEKAAEVLSQLRSSLGTYAVLGNHDWWLDPGRVSRALESNNIRMLEDASTTLNVRGCTFTLVGISDFWEGPHDLKKAFGDVPADGTTIVFTHNPDIFPELPRPVTLAIAGHTHGGQVALPVIGRPIVPSQFGQRFAAGTVVENGQTYFISTGTGTSILPVRFGVTPEVTVLELEAH